MTYRTHILGGVAIGAVVTTAAGQGYFGLTPLSTPAIFGTFIAAMFGSVFPGHLTNLRAKWDSRFPFYQADAGHVRASWLLSQPAVPADSALSSRSLPSIYGLLQPCFLLGSLDTSIL